MITRKPKNVRRTLSRAAIAGLAVLGAPAPSHANPVQNASEERKVAMTMKDDLANRSPDIHWPQGFDPARADLFAHNELLIDATCERVWRHIIAAPKWPEWYPNSKDVRILGDGGTVLNHGTTYGFRPGRGQHDTLDALAYGINVSPAGGRPTRLRAP